MKADSEAVTLSSQETQQLALDYTRRDASDAKRRPAVGRFDGVGRPAPNKARAEWCHFNPKQYSAFAVRR